jgi:hypothetical protein
MAYRGEPVASCWEWHGDGTAGKRDVGSRLGGWRQLGRWVRPVQDDTSLVGKLPKAAWQDSWALLARTTCKGTTKRRIDRASLATEHHVVPPGRIRPEEVA